LSNREKRSREKWKQKARRRGVVIRKQKKRMKEVERSRDMWRKRAESGNTRPAKGAETASRKPAEREEKPKRYWFELSLIVVILKGKLNTSVSFRAISQLLGIFAVSANLWFRQPTHATVINWVHKVGYYELMREKEKADDWVILLDHSMGLGRDKVFVVYGIRQSQIDFSRALRSQDLVTLMVVSKEKWDGEIVRDCLLEVEEQVGKIIYAVGDYGPDLKKGLRLAGIKHVHDIGHRIALILEKMYKNDARYQEFLRKLTEMIKQLGQTELAYIIPPKQRKKARYQNMSVRIGWAVRMLKCLRESRIGTEEREKMEWMEEYRDIIEELSAITTATRAIEKVLKCSGLSRHTASKCRKITKKLTTEKGKIVHKRVAEYLRDSLLLLPENKTTLCSSDILESSFGKYKSYLSNNPMAGTTNLVLCLAAFTSSLDESEVRKALETTTVQDIKDWTEQNVGETLLQKRRALLVA